MIIDFAIVFSFVIADVLAFFRSGDTRFCRFEQWRSLIDSQQHSASFSGSISLATQEAKVTFPYIFHFSSIERKNINKIINLDIAK
jgi:hypothetical protein